MNKWWIAAARLAALGCLMVSLPLRAEVFHAAFFNPQGVDDPFWKPVTEVMQAAARQLDIRLDVYAANHDRLRLIEQVRQVVTGADKPDVILFKNAKQSAGAILRLAEDNQVRAFMFNAGLSEDEARELGRPREKFRYWIGEMLPDDWQAGHDLAGMLTLAARERQLVQDGQPIRMLGLGGPPGDRAARARLDGLQAAVEQTPDVRLLQVVPAGWNREEAYRKTLGLLRRYGRVEAIWAANDPMALGALDALQESGYLPGRTVLVGGIDWNPPALAAVREGRLLTTLGGHFLEGGYALVVLHDYFRGVDFARRDGVSLKTRLGLLTQENIGRYAERLDGADWNRIPFRQFSLVLTPGDEHHDFSLDRLLEML